MYKHFFFKLELHAICWKPEKIEDHSIAELRRNERRGTRQINQDR